MLDVLIIGAHPDDAEISSGGTLAKMQKMGKKVGILDLTDGEPTPNGDHETRMKEAEKAKEKLDLSFRKTLDFSNRYLMDNLEARTEAAEVIRTQRPDILLTQHSADLHPDHVASAKIGKFARFYGKLTKTDMRGDPYFAPLWLNFFSSHLRTEREPSFLIDISSTMEQKMDAVKQYKSQLGEVSEDGSSYERIRAYNSYWGGKIGTKYAEPFYAPESLGLDGLDSILKSDG